MKIQWLRVLAASAVLAFVVLPAAEAQPAGTAGTTIKVTSLADNLIIFPGQPVPCTLRDAIQAANTNRAVHGCAAGMAPRFVSASPLRIDFIDRIVFDVGAGTPRIQPRSALPRITEAVTIDGATGGATRIEINGSQVQILGAANGVTVTGTYATLKSLVVNGFTGNGILLSHEEGSGGGNTVLDCLVGTDAAGTRAVPNGLGTTAAAGIAVLSPGNLIGGAEPGAGNVIAGNRGRGVLLDGPNNLVIGNLIGVGVGSVPLGNQFDGIFVDGGQFSNADAQILSNTIANNGGDGVEAGYNVVSILSNRIYANGGLGIEKAGTGVTANDPAGLRSRPPNYPLLQAATVSLPTGTTVFGQITQSSVAPITLQFFYGTTCDPSQYGEGPTSLGSTQVNGGSHVLFQFVYRNLLLHGFITATATTANGTSEFSACLPI